MPLEARQAVEMGDNINGSQTMSNTAQIEWLNCDQIEAVPGRCGGRPTIKGTRIEPELLLIEAELGRTPEETHDDFPSLPVATIRAIQAFVARQKQLVP
jgi:uncharacterized protein (DUF433 family)